jgi:glycosyltransferase involved in cell wall biosynthesis
MLDLTIAVPVLNEEKNLPECLDSIGKEFARHVVIIDSGSTDKTREIAKQYGAEVVDFDWDGRFPKKRNWFLRNHLPDTAWVLFLDADENLTTEFKEELIRTLPGSKKSGYWLRYTIHFLGASLKGGYPLQKLALFRTGAGEYEEIAEERWSNLDMEVHEHPVIKGAIGKIRARIDHRETKTDKEDVARHADYAAWEAARIKASDRDTADRQRWTWRQRMKRYIVTTPFAGSLYFVGSFLFMGGFLDGMRGVRFAYKKAAYFSLIYHQIKK